MNRPPIDLTVIRTEVEGAQTLALTGRLDAHQVKQLLQATEPLTARNRLDLAGVTFMDSSGLAALVKLTRLAAEHGKSLEIVNVQDSVRLAMEITGLYSLLPIRPA